MQQNLNTKIKQSKGMSSLVFILEDLSSQVTGIIAGIVIGVVSVLLAELLLNFFKKPKFLINPTSKMFDVGFLVKVKNKNIQDAKVYCDDTHIKWTEKDGTEKETKNLRVGELAFFYPFKIVLSKEKMSKYADKTRQCVGVSITQKMVTYGQNFTNKSEKPIYHERFKIPKGNFFPISVTKNHWFPKFHSRIRITGEGIEKEINRYFDFTCHFTFSRYVDSDKIEDLFIDCDFGEAELTI